MMTNSADRPESSDFAIADDIDALFGGANPNPDRIGCPAPEVLLLLSRRERPIDDPAYDHLADCSPCYRHVRALQQRRGVRGTVQQHGRLKWIAAIAASLLVAITGMWLYSRTDSPVPPRETLATDLRVQLDLRQFTVSRSPQDDRPHASLELPRDRVIVTMLLPAGAEPGAYDVQLLDAEARPRASASGEAAIRSFVTTLELSIDLRSTAAGAYQLALRREDEDWRMFPAVVK